MELSKSELRVFRAISLEPGIGIRDIRGKTKISEPRAYSLVRSLRRKGLVKVDHNYGMRLYPFASQLARALRSQKTGLIEEAFSGKRLELLTALYNGSRSVEEISKAINLSDKRVYYYLSWFRSFGLVRGAGGVYFLSKDHPFYKGLSLLLSRPARIPPEIEQGAFVSWTGENEYIVHTSKPEEYTKNLPKKFSAARTGRSLVDHYGIHIIPPDTTLYIAGKGSKINLEDLILHLLLDDPDREQNKQYARWLIQKHEDEIDFPGLKRKAIRYKLFKNIDSILYDLKPILKKKNW
ncbi:MAG: ArsR family transcriptional regulator [Candidatus Altiarchaeales archaeon]|nr:ArsR family transcriptional regulator [Candidatus Altiarchaeota archaeon]MBU4437384.1 ArsR family transcriptional regulator [Candidatus Altiarchaeota archaeon]MCG2783130.1 ArsR family transcriptional regulator [Candidatus Altiarchaeales archaeon]